MDFGGSTTFDNDDDGLFAEATDQDFSFAVDPTHIHPQSTQHRGAPNSATTYSHNTSHQETVKRVSSIQALENWLVTMQATLEPRLHAIEQRLTVIEAESRRTGEAMRRCLGKVNEALESLNQMMEPS
ncbi:hypothetical protein LTR51_008666 [Lithohypha guttulata]|nr:hypothetical protein LTR51_008666 [Lithohypha guttulata]